MKMLLITLLFIPLSLFANERISGDQVKNLLIDNFNKLNNYVEGSVYQLRSSLKETTENGLECKYESFWDITFLLVSKDHSGLYLYFEAYNKMDEGSPNYDECAKTILIPKISLLEMMDDYLAPGIKYLNELSHTNKEFFRTSDGLIISSDGKEDCYMDLNMPYFFMNTKCFSDGVLTSQIQRLPDANLEVLYNKLKDNKISRSYPSGPNTSSSYELPMTFGELLKEWKNNP
jgi:hypothetical protein